MQTPPRRARPVSDTHSGIPLPLPQHYLVAAVRECEGYQAEGEKRGSSQGAESATAVHLGRALAPGLLVDAQQTTRDAPARVLSLPRRHTVL